MAGVEVLQQQTPNAAAEIVRRTSPVAASLLSLLVPGLGAAYNGQTSKALVHFAIFASFFQMATVTDGHVPLFPLGVLATWLYSAVDAYRTAQLLRAGLRPETAEDAIARRLYGNPLASRGQHFRREWFGTACCPANIARLVARTLAALEIDPPRGDSA